MPYDIFPSAAAPPPPLRPHALGFLYNHGGLNNQKMAVAGLFLQAIEQRKPVCLPYLYVKDHRSPGESITRFHNVFELGAVAGFAARHGIAIDAAGPIGERGGWEEFRYFAHALTHASAPPMLQALLDAVSALQPRVVSHPTFLRLKDFVFGALGIEVAIQLRIEHDWQPHAAELRKIFGDVEEFDIGFAGILSKVRLALPDLRLAYVTADEDGMPASKDEIREFSRSRFGLDLLWKSDLLSRNELDAFNPLDLSIIDFEMAKYCRRFVGRSNSTFSNLLCLEKFARTRADVPGQYIYNCNGNAALERQDNGFTSDPQAAVQPSRAAELVLHTAAR